MYLMIDAFKFSRLLRFLEMQFNRIDSSFFIMKNRGGLKFTSTSVFLNTSNMCSCEPHPPEAITGIRTALLIQAKIN